MNSVVDPSMAYGSPAPSQPVDFQRFTAAGRPMGSAPVMAASGYSGLAGATAGVMYGPNVLPTRFTDDSIILVPIKVSDLQDPDDNFDEWWQSLRKETGTRRRSFKSRMRSVLLRSPAGAKKGDFVTIKMTRGDYLKYCAKDEKGAYIGTEPQNVSRSVLREMVERQQTERSSSTASVPITDSGSPISRPDEHQRRPTYG